MDFVTDRTESDALLGNERGVYSYTDLNRVEAAVRDLAAELSDIGYKISLVTKTDWGLPGDFSAKDWPVESQMDRYLRNVRYIRNFFPASIRLPTSMEGLTWEGANNIEKVLKNAAERIAGIKQTWRYSGEVFAGEEL